MREGPKDKPINGSVRDIWLEAPTGPWGSNIKGNVESAAAVCIWSVMFSELRFYAQADPDFG